MVSPQILLGIAVGVVLLLLGAYLLWLAARIEQLEREAPDPPDPPET